MQILRIIHHFNITVFDDATKMLSHARIIFSLIEDINISLPFRTIIYLI